MNCREIKPLLPEYTAGRLSQEETERIASHLKSCTFCRADSLEITRFIESIRREEPKTDTPPGFFETVWDNLYRRIQKEGLNKPGETILRRLTDFLYSFRPGVFQIVNVVLIISAGTWFFVSYRADITKPSQTLVQNLIERATPQLQNEMGEKIDKGRETLVDIMSMGLASKGEPIEKLKNFIDPEKQRQLYNSLTDGLADIVIKISKKS